MKRFVLKPLMWIFGILITSLLILLLILFFKPLVIINPQNLARLLTSTDFLKEWSWEKASMNHKWRAWNDRIFSGSFKDLCFIYQNKKTEVDTCLENFSWNLNLTFTLLDGFEVRSLGPIKLTADRTHITFKEAGPENKKGKSSPPDIWKYWQYPWKKYMPDVDIKLGEVVVIKGDREFKFDLDLEKIGKKIKASSLGFNLVAGPEKLVIKAPKDYPLPDRLGLGRTIFLRNVKLIARPTREGIPLELTGGLEAIRIVINSYLDLPLKHDFTSTALKKDLLLATEADLFLPDVKGNLEKHAPQPLSVLPAPLNVMNGTIRMKLKTLESDETDEILVDANTHIDLKSKKQSLQMNILGEMGLDVASFDPGPITLGFDFERVHLLLPRLSKSSAPPQFFPDGRIKRTREKPESSKQPVQAEEERPLVMELVAQGEDALHILSNLLNEALRLNMDLTIADAKIQEGYIQVLPFKTKVFKRPIYIPGMRFIFNQPLEPVIKGQIVFPLPEYKITLSLEGPISSPSYAFSSKPPLPQEDIWAVLLFGRPMHELSPDDNVAARKTSQILSQGILSLSVLYFLSGSPVEYVGYDPNTGGALAQIGLDSKSSVQVGAGREGWSSTSVRRSLGKGWYLDTSVQESNRVDRRNERATYGVLLERIIAY